MSGASDMLDEVETKKKVQKFGSFGIQNIINVKVQVTEQNYFVVLNQGGR
jgi:hypothetical protein